MKCDLHRHIGGAISAQTVYDIIKHHDPSATITLEDIQKRLVYGPEDTRTFKHFLSKFDVLDQLIWDPWSIARAVKQICWDVAKERIDYCELKFSIGRYVKHTGWSPEEVLLYLKDVISEEEDKWNIKFGLVLALKYEAPRDQQKLFARTIFDDRVARIIDGIDLVGDEEYFNADFYMPIFANWRAAEKGLQTHTGESQSADNVRRSITDLKVNRIAHGIKAVEHPDIIKLALDNNICFDVALTSNLYTGVIADIRDHPIRRMINSGLTVTIGTDDPSILAVNLDEEYTLAQSTFNFSDDEIVNIMENSVKFAFNKSLISI